MKKRIFVGASLLAAMNAQASDVGAMFGISYAFGGGGVGFTVQATTTRHDNKAAAAAGFSYYPFSTTGMKFGIPVGVGYQGENMGGFANYDVLMERFSVSGGYIDTRDEDNSRPASVTAGEASPNAGPPTAPPIP